MGSKLSLHHMHNCSLKTPRLPFNRLLMESERTQIDSMKYMINQSKKKRKQKKLKQRKTEKTNKPKNTPTATQSGGVNGWKMSRIHATLSRVGDRGKNVENSCGNPPENLFWSTSHWLQMIVLNWETCREEQLSEPSNEPSLKQQPFAPEHRKRLGGWNLPRKLLAAQDRSAPENHRESESNSALKPWLWLKTPKLLMGNKNRERRANKCDYNAIIYSCKILQRHISAPHLLQPQILLESMLGITTLHPEKASTNCAPFKKSAMANTRP